MSIVDLCRESAGKWKASAAIHDQDFIFRFFLEHPRFSTPDAAVREYFDTGRKSAEMLRSVLSDDLSVNVTADKKLLEFASGYGAVTRHLHEVLPAFDITSSDIHQEANDFIASEIGTRTVPSSSAPESFDPAGDYDVVFALSFFSHMPKSTWYLWIKALFNAVRGGGNLIFTTHGATTLRLLPTDVVLDDDGFGFRSQSEQGDLEGSEYGTTYTSCGFVVGQLEKLANCEVRLVRAGLWYGHQDLYVATKVASTTKTPVAESRVIHGDEKAEGYVDSAVVIEKRISTEKRRILRASGWASPDVKRGICADEILLLFRTDGGSSYSCETLRNNRPDVADAFGNPELIGTGFVAEVDITELGGKVTMLLATRFGNELKLCRNVSIALESVKLRVT